ncbi:MAG: protein phosphatase 2C domain-containing protein [Lachnospiraceae bacterium]|nr:protein phosphatase 2C domain-containing protein [Lachnospiraceae bacterium]
MFDYAMKSKPGDRPYNEDRMQMCDLGGEQLFALADGLGGMKNGELASSIAIRSVIGRFRWDRAPGFLEHAMETAQNAVFYGQEKYPGASGMSTTLALLHLRGKTVRWAHIGDTRIYMFRKNKLLYQTEDHSVPQMLVKQGEITAAQIRHHPDRNRLIRTLGQQWSGQGYAVSRPVEIEAGDAFLLCSDGFWEEIEEQEMARRLRRSGNVARWLEQMTEIAEENGRTVNMDNYSAICVRILTN